MIENAKREREFALKERLMLHVERYRLTIPQVVAKLFFPAHLFPDREKALQKASQLLSAHAKGGLLTEGECPAAPGASRPKYYLPHGAAPGEAAVNADVALLWYCLGGKVMRHRLTRQDIQGLLDDPPYRNIAHCIEPVRGIDGFPAAGVIYRMAPTTAEVKEIVRMTRRHLKDARKRFAAVVDSGDYGFAILVDNKAKAKTLSDALSQPHPEGDPPLNQQARVVVHVAPRADTLAKTLRNAGEKK